MNKHNYKILAIMKGTKQKIIRGSITIDHELMEASGILKYEKVQVVDVENGERLETYVIKGEQGTGVVCLNGAAARFVQKGDHVIIMAYAIIKKNEIDSNKQKIVIVDERNKITKVSDHIE